MQEDWTSEFFELVDGTSRPQSFSVTPKHLYHYTRWEVLRLILQSQRMRATAFDCTNDGRELVTADREILRAAQWLRRRHWHPVVVASLDLFLESYLEKHVSTLVPVYLTCFSADRDSLTQWRRYGDDGDGVCIGLRVLDERLNTTRPTFAVFTAKVDYDRLTWYQNAKKMFAPLCELAKERVPRRVAGADLKRAILHLTNGFFRMAAFCAIQSKQPEWRSENEYRTVILVAESQAFPVVEWERSNGMRARAVDVALRDAGRLLALSDIIVGSRRSFGDSADQIRSWLASAGYQPELPEYPAISASQLRRL